MPAKPKSERNGSERNVPNGSELGFVESVLADIRRGRGFHPSALNGANDPNPYERSINTTTTTGNTSTLGRPALLSDSQLMDTAKQLHRSNGRLPKLDELIAASGGCQRQRASRVLQRFRDELAAREVRNQLTLPHDLESELRQWIDRWVQLASGQLAQRHAQLTSGYEDKLHQMDCLIEEQQIVIAELRDKSANLQKVLTETIERNVQLSESVQRMRAERDIAQAVAEDRIKLLTQFNASQRDDLRTR